MKLHANTDDGTVEIEITRDGRSVTAKVDGREYQLDASQPERGVYLLKHGSKVFQAAVTSDSGTSIEISGNSYDVAIHDPRKLRSNAGDAQQNDGRAEIKTAMPGKVVRILRSLNETVAKGDGLIVVEAMKMQNEMRSPKDGIVAAINTSEGETVNAGEVLLVVE